MSNSPEETIQIGKDISVQLKPGAVIALQGTLGSGKTTFVKGIAQGLDIIEDITSPTYTIISEYYGNKTLYHMDLYRIDSTEEFELLGTDEIIYGEGITVIEWSEKISDRLPDNTIIITISIVPEKKRKLNIVGI
ncbi:MAG: tRNA (adenosine(37)-N6)-threonylcarbamoyltransferase complex ATPase subunit type 1 TsaE [Spirochaetales bacterium]|nr:tRNA (adenosine(37)-N6)-threonylcarbamoyltransferase complex ATPase subunit type 1 TsaE [Spirochaetales bacterium]